MFKYPDIFITPTSAAKNLMLKTFKVARTDIYQSQTPSNTGNFGWNINSNQGNNRGLKMELPAQATIAGMFFQNVQLANSTGTGIAGNMRIGRELPVIGMSAPNSSTTATVYCQYAHGLTTADTVLISDSVAVVQGTGATYATPTAFNNCVPITVNGVATNTVGGPNQGTKVSYAVTPHATDPTIFTITLGATTSAAIQAGTIGAGFGSSGSNASLGTVGLVVADQYYASVNVNTGGVAIGFQTIAARNIGTFASQNTTTGSVAGYWQVAPNQPIGVVTTPGTPNVWSVSSALSALLGGDGNYNYFVEPGQDLLLHAYYQETVSAGSVTSATVGGPWTVFVYFFM
jgi:hypothetical protein